MKRKQEGEPKEFADLRRSLVRLLDAIHDRKKHLGGEKMWKATTGEMVDELAHWMQWDASRDRTLYTPLLMELPQSWYAIAKDLSGRFGIDSHTLLLMMSQVCWKWGTEFTDVELTCIVTDAVVMSRGLK